MSEEYFSWRSKGEGATYRECLQRHTPCPDCGVELTARSMTAHHRKLHGTETEIDWDQLPFRQTEYLPLVYKFIFLTNIQSCQCPLPWCPRTYRIRSGIQNHFSRIQWGDIITIFEEHPTPFHNCEQCERQVPPWPMNNLHYNTKA